MSAAAPVPRQSVLALLACKIPAAVIVRGTSCIGRAGRLGPGSLPWLLAHDIRLAWRDFRSTFRALDDRVLAVLLVLLLAVMHAAAWPLAGGFDPETLPAAAAAVYARMAPAVLFVLLLMVAQTLNGVTRLLYTRRDLDLLFSSPLSIGKILLVRTLGVAGGALASASIFVIPLADAGTLQGNLRCLALYPAVVGGALLAATISLLIALGLFALIGPRLTRLAGQVVATFIGAGFMISLQLRGFLPDVSLAQAIAAGRKAGSPATLMLLLPVRAALGEAGPLLIWMGLTVGLFAGVTLLLARRFARNSSMASVGASARGARSRGSRANTADAAARKSEIGRFGGSLRGILHAKEWRLIARDPWVVSQILLQILYMTPMIAILWGGGNSIALALGPMIVVVTFQVASSLTWLSLSGEDAPELLATAPVSPSVLRRGKIEAVGALTLAIVILPLVCLAVLNPAAALETLALGLLGLGLAVLLQLWHGQPAKRSAFAARHRASKLLALIEMGLSMLLGIASALAVTGSVLALLPLGMGGAIMLCARPRRRLS